MYEERPGPRNCTWSNYLGGLRGQIGFFVLLLMVTNGLWLCDNSQVSTWKGQINNSFSPPQDFLVLVILLLLLLVSTQHNSLSTSCSCLVVFSLPLLKKYSLTYLNCLKNLASETSKYKHHFFYNFSTLILIYHNIDVQCKSCKPTCLLSNAFHYHFETIFQL